MVTQTDLDLGDGRKLHVYDTNAGDADGRLAVFWHHGTPNIGAPPEPLFGAAARLGLRWVSYDRPGYGGSTPLPGRDVASAAACVSSIADALGLGEFAVMGHSGGGPHALACAALLPGGLSPSAAQAREAPSWGQEGAVSGPRKRVVGAVVVAGLAPYGAPGLDWFAGMAASGVESLRAAAGGRAAQEAYLASGAEYDPEFTPADLAALSGAWAWLGDVVRPAVEAGPGGSMDDDLAYVAPWGFDAAQVVAPVLVLHGGRDRVVPCAHGEWVARRCRSAELRLYPDDGHISVLNSSTAALEWLRERAG